MKLYNIHVLIFLFILFLPVSCTKSQVVCYLLDEETNLPVDSARIVIHFHDGNRHVGDGIIYTNHNGRFVLDLPEDKIRSYSVIEIRKTNYYRKEIYSFYQLRDTLYLNPEPKEDVWDSMKIKYPLQSGDTTLVINEVYVPILNGDTLFADTLRTRIYIYIDPSRSSRYYNAICDFSVDKEEFRSYYAVPSKKKKVPNDLPREWIPLYLYNGDYYLYAPCEWVIDKYKITDSVLISYGWMDGDYGFSYEKIIRHSDSFYSIDGIEDKPFAAWSAIAIYIIDNQQGLAVFEYKYEDRTSRYGLKVRADKARQFPIIIHDCKWKQLEYEFEEPDYEALLKKFKK